MIMLNATQAAAVAGHDTPDTALAPVALADGVTFVLPEAVLTDPAHQSHWAVLAALPVRVVAPGEYPASS